MTVRSAPAQLSRRSAIGFLAAAAATAATAVSTASAQTPGNEIAAGTPPNDSAGPIMYALDAGFYERAGLNVKLTVLGNPGPLVAAVASGAMPIAGVPVTQLAVAREKGLPLVMLAPLSLYLSSAPTNALIVLKNSPLHRAADLNGKTVATRDLGNMSYFGARTWLAKNGADLASIHWIELPDTQVMAALVAGRIDAASVGEPALDAALGADARVIAPVFDAIAKRFLVAGCVTLDTYAKAHPETMRSFADAIANAAKWANENRDRSAKILEKYAQAPVLPGSTRVTYAERLRASDVQPVLDVMTASGQLKSPMHAVDLFSSAVPSS